MSELVHLIAADMEWDMNLRDVGMAVAYGSDMCLGHLWIRMVDKLIGTWTKEGSGPALKSTMAEGLKVVRPTDVVSFIPVGHTEVGGFPKGVIAGRIFLRGWHVRYLSCNV